VAQIVYSARAIDHLERAFEFIAAKEPHAARAAVAAIQSAITMLAAHPLIGRRVEREVRELVISYGRTGYIALYRFDVVRDEIRVLAIRHQRELDYPG
jgi:plasmid stabilization system protein ParE